MDRREASEKLGLAATAAYVAATDFHLYRLEIPAVVLSCSGKKSQGNPWIIGSSGNGKS